MKEENLISEEERDTVKLDIMRDQTVNKIENLIKEQPDSEKKKNSSLQTVFSIWNTMIGSTMVSIPFNVYYAGILPTIIVGLLYGFVCYITCAVIVRLGGKEDDFAVIVYNYLSYAFGQKTAKVGKIIQIIFNLAINTGATFIYFLIINQNLYPCICLLLKAFKINIDALDLEPRFDRFSLFYCALIVTAIEFPLTILRELRFLSKFNSYGIFFVSALLVFVIYTGIRTMAIDSFSFEYKENVDGSKLRYLYLFGESPGLLTGTLSLGLFCHSVILQLVKNNRKQENNQRDLLVGYILVTFTYIFIGIMGYIGFSGSYFDSEIFVDNWFRFFKSDNYYILALRLLNVVQLISIFPVLFFVVRNQLFNTFFEQYISSIFHIILFSFILLLLCLLVLYFCYDVLSSLISYIGASTALVLIYSIAPVTNMIYYYIRHQTREEVEKIIQEKKAKHPNVEERIKYIFPDNLREPVPLKPVKAFFFYLSMMMIILVGIITFILQFFNVNFFNIKIKKN
jgi:sodium-coupled neutral amino acid transporter 9